ncbi:MAG: lantibiotic dehydratase family protein [Hyphomicrobiales bacterium]
MKNYKAFTKYTLRTPVNSINKLDKETFTLEDFKNDKEFLQAVRLASPVLFEDYEKWEKGYLKDKKKEDHLLFSFMKYHIRSCMRCTPFGLFAGLNLGELGDETSIVLSEKNQHEPHTRLDMNYLCSLIQNLEKRPEVRNQLTFFPNNSYYIIGNQIRYIEYSYFNTRRKHQISAVENNEYLTLIIEKSKEGAKREELGKLLVGDEITFEDAVEFIDALIDNQLLVSNLDPTVTGEELHDFIINKIKDFNIDDDIFNEITGVKEDVARLDHSKLGTAIENYTQISNRLKKLEIPLDEKYLFQTDLVLNTKKNTIDEAILENIKKACSLLNKFTYRPKETNLSKFAEAFTERYEDREVPLLKVLDVESGIGYIQNNSGAASDHSPLVDDLAIPLVTSKGIMANINWARNLSILLDKYTDTVKNNKEHLELTDEDVKDMEENWDDLASTFSVNTRITRENGEEKIALHSVGGSSTVNLLGRFGHSKKNLAEFLVEIGEKEKELNKDMILAEIVHLPESRVGNILSRPIFREYEIPYLAQSAVKQENQIPLDDLLVSVKQNKVVLRSKRLNKIVKPHLGNAHNFSANALPAYHFLADLQTQDLRGGIGIHWGQMEHEFNFLPRIVYKNIILSEATWGVKQKEIENLKKIKDDAELMTAFNELREKRKFHRYIILADYDNELLFDLDKVQNVKLLMSLVKNRPSFTLKEFIFSDNDSIVTDENGNAFTNEIIFSFYKENEPSTTENN